MGNLGIFSFGFFGNLRILKFWNSFNLRFWDFEDWEFQEFGGFQNFKFWGLGNLGILATLIFLILGIFWGNFGDSVVLRIWNFGNLGILNFRNSEIWEFEIFCFGKFRNFENFNFSDFGIFIFGNLGFPGGNSGNFFTVGISGIATGGEILGIWELKSGISGIVAVWEFENSKF